MRTQLRGEIEAYPARLVSMPLAGGVERACPNRSERVIAVEDSAPNWSGLGDVRNGEKVEFVTASNAYCV
jgi:hypothetical protein